MKKEELVGLIIRIAMIFMFFYLIRDGAVYIATANRGGSDNETWLIAGGILLLCLLLFTSLIYKYAIAIAKKIIPIEKKDTIKLEWALKDLEISVLIIAGIIILFIAVSDIVYWLILLFQYSTLTEAQAALPPSSYAAFYSTIAEILFGIFLIFGANGIRGFVYKIRYLGAK